MTENDRIYFLIPHKENLEVFIRAFVNENDLVEEIQGIKLQEHYRNSLKISQIIATRIADDKYKFEAQFFIDNDEKNQLVNAIEGMNYSKLNE